MKNIWWSKGHLIALLIILGIMCWSWGYMCKPAFSCVRDISREYILWIITISILAITYGITTLMTYLLSKNKNSKP